MLIYLYYVGKVNLAIAKSGPWKQVYFYSQNCSSTRFQVGLYVLPKTAVLCGSKRVYLCCPDLQFGPVRFSFKGLQCGSVAVLKKSTVCQLCGGIKDRVGRAFIPLSGRRLKSGLKPGLKVASPGLSLRLSRLIDPT